MKILITTEFSLSFQCGVTTAVINERKCLEALGHEVRILTIYKDKVSKYEDGVYYIRSNFPQLYKDSYAALILSDPIFEEIYEWNPDIVHSQCEFFTMACAKRISKKLDIPLVHTCHTEFDAYGVHFTRNDKLWDWVTSTFIPLILRRVDYIICPTEKNYELLKNYEVTNPMTVFPCGVDLSMFNRSLSPEERIALRAENGIGEDDTVLISVCRLSEEKNVEESILYFKHLLQKRPDVKFLIVGDGDEKVDLEKQVDDLNLSESVRFSGSVPMTEVWKYYKLGDIFISNSVSESLGLTYIEALASSVPIVCRWDKALSASLIDGVNGYSFLNVEEFMNKIIPLIDDSEMRKKMGVSAQKSVEKFSLDKFAANLLNVFNNVKEEKRRKAESI